MNQNNYSKQQQTHEHHDQKAQGAHRDAGDSGHNAHEETKKHVDHSGHEQMFRTRFYWSLLLSIPVLIYSPMLQRFLNFTAPDFPGSTWIPFIFSLIIFGYGGVPFLKMAVPEI